MPSFASTARSLILLQLLSRALTFTLNQLLLRVASPSVFGTAAVQFDLVLSTILFLSREGVRLTVLRAPKDDPSISDQQISTLSYLPLPLSIAISAVLVPLYLRSMPTSTTSQPSFHLSLGIYIVAAVLELSVEPLYNSAQREGKVKIRVRAEGIAVIVRAVTTVGVVGLGGEQWALRGFALGQLSYALALVAKYRWEGTGRNQASGAEIKDSDLPALNATLVKRAGYQSLQSVLKHLLTEADRIVVSLACTLSDQGGWAVVVGYGSLITRIIFQPMEESTLLYFSRTFADIRSDAGNPEKDKELTARRDVALRVAAKHLRTLLQFSTHLLILLPAFLPPLLPSLLPFVLPRQYLTVTSTTASTLVTYLSVYIPLLSLNGISEAFFAATASPRDLAGQSKAMALGSAAFAATLYAYSRPESTALLAEIGIDRTTITTETALIYANATQLVVRILFALRHAKRLFAPCQGITNTSVSPDQRTTALVLGCAAALRMAQTKYRPETANLETKAAFVAAGGLAGLACLLSAYIFTFRGLLYGSETEQPTPAAAEYKESATTSAAAASETRNKNPAQRLRAALAARRAGIPLEADPLNPSQDARTFAAAITRRRRMTTLLHRYSRLLQATLILAGLGWLLLLPSDFLRKRSYVDEHAMSPGGVHTHFDWSDVHQADLYLNDIERLWENQADGAVRSKYLVDTLTSSGIPASSLEYAFSTSNGTIAGVTTYAHVSPPRSAGTETILISANWLSLQGGSNLRGVSLLLALAKFLRSQNHWAFDFAIVFGDGYLDGVQAFLAAYYGVEQSNLQVNNLDLPLAGNIWTALNVDYPGHSFSHLGMFYEGVNGRLPNQDIMNAIAYVSRWTGGVPIRLHNIEEEAPDFDLPPWLSWLSPSKDHMRKYIGGLEHIKTHFGYAAFGRPSGAHGVFAKYRIDAITLFASPADGPHGFHAFGRTLEASMRSLNNLLERLHASYFFYILPSPESFLPVGQYLPAIILIGVGITVGGLAFWVDAGWVGGPSAWIRRKRPVALSLVLAAGCFAQGLALWHMDRFLSTSLVDNPITHPMTMSSFIIGYILVSDRYQDDALRPTLSSFSHLLIGAILSALSMVNFPQACLLMAALLPVLLTPVLNAITGRIWSPLAAFKGALVIFMSPYTLTSIARRSRPLLWSTLEQEYEVVGNLALPGIYLVWWPLWQMATLAVMLAP